MNKEQFERLELEQQVQYINDCLQETSMVKACQNIGTNESTVRDRFKRGGYKRQGNQFVATSDTVNTNNISNIINTNNISGVKVTDEKARESKSKTNNIKVLENRINSLENELEKLKDIVLSNTSNTINTIDASSTRAIKKYESDNLVSRNYKIDKEVAEQFVKFCKIQKLTNDYKVSDLATNALVEFMKTFND